MGNGGWRWKIGPGFRKSKGHLRILKGERRESCSQGIPLKVAENAEGNLLYVEAGGVENEDWGILFLL